MHTFYGNYYAYVCVYIVMCDYVYLYYVFYKNYLYNGFV